MLTELQSYEEICYEYLHRILFLYQAVLNVVSTQFSRDVAFKHRLCQAGYH